MSSKKNVIVVTGGATGIGKAITETLSKNKDNVIILCYNRSKDDAIEISKNNDNIQIFKIDVTKEKDFLNLRSFLIEKFKRIHAIINNAGGNIGFETTESFNIDNWDKTYDLNCKSVFLMSKFINPLIKDNGAVVNISSISALSGGAPGGMAYASAKAAVDCMTKSLAKELADKNITVNSVSPGIVYTNQHKLFSSKEYYKSLIDKVPLNRDGKCEDIANLVSFLISEKGSYITGQILGINGGMLMR